MEYFNFCIYMFFMVIYYYYCSVVNYVPMETKVYLGGGVNLYSFISFFLPLILASSVCLFINKFNFNKRLLNLVKFIFIFILFQLILAGIMFFGNYLYDSTNLVFFTLFAISKQHAFGAAILFMLSILVTLMIKSAKKY